MPEQQLVEMACALGAGARVLIIGVRPRPPSRKEQHLLYRRWLENCMSGVGIIYISHRLEEVFS